MSDDIECHREIDYFPAEQFDRAAARYVHARLPDGSPRLDPHFSDDGDPATWTGVVWSSQVWAPDWHPAARPSSPEHGGAGGAGG